MYRCRARITRGRVGGDGAHRGSREAAHVTAVYGGGVHLSVAELGREAGVWGMAGAES